MTAPFSLMLSYGMPRVTGNQRTDIPGYMGCVVLATLEVRVVSQRSAARAMPVVTWDAKTVMRSLVIEQLDQRYEPSTDRPRSLAGDGDEALLNIDFRRI